MSRSPPLSMYHPGLYHAGDMDENPSMVAVAGQSLTVIPIEDEEAAGAVADADADAASGSGSGSLSQNPAAVAKPEKKRRRPALSCEQCRKRKIRCDRGLPCVNCVKSKITPCTYAPTHIPASRVKKTASQAHDHDHGSDRTSSVVPIRAAPPAHESARPSSSEHIRQGPAGPFYGSRSSSSIPSSTVGSTSDNSTVDALVQRVRQLEQQLENNVHISRNTEDRFVPNEEEERGPLKGTISKTRFFGQSHWMNGADLVSRFPQRRLMLHP